MLGFGLKSAINLELTGTEEKGEEGSSMILVSNEIVAYIF